MLRTEMWVCILLFVMHSASVAAEPFLWPTEEVQLNQSALGDDRGFILKYFKEEYPWPPPITADDVYVARYDLTGDGLPELIVGLGGSGNFCGTAGCIARVFHKVGGRWKLLSHIRANEGGGAGGALRIYLARSEFPAMVVDDDGKNRIWSRITVPAERDGRKTFFNHTGGLFWDGKKYRYFCLERCGQEEG